MKNEQKLVRMKIRLNYKLRKNETEKIRKKFIYKLRDLVGLAPVLKTDNRCINIFIALQYMHVCIYTNINYIYVLI
jgi:hypothetical protein